jgi:hypothetical protein
MSIEQRTPFEQRLNQVRENTSLYSKFPQIKEARRNLDALKEADSHYNKAALKNTGDNKETKITWAKPRKLL